MTPPKIKRIESIIGVFVLSIIGTLSHSVIRALTPSIIEAFFPHRVKIRDGFMVLGLGVFKIGESLYRKLSQTETN